MNALTVAIRHYDSRVFPDDSDWFQHFEHYVVDLAAHLRIVHVRSADDCDQVLMPLQWLRGPSGLSVLASLENYYSTDYRPICLTEASRQLITPMLDQLLREESPDQLCFRAMDPDAAETEAVLSALKASGWHAYVSTCHVNWVHELAGDYEHYLDSRPGRLKNTLKRKTRKLMALPGMNLRVHKDCVGLDQAIDAYQQIYDQSWKVPEASPDFIPELMRAQARRGHLRLGILRLGDVPVAAHLWIVKEQIGFIYKLAHKKEFDQYSPGTVLLGQMISHTMQHDQVKRLDFLTGDDPYKRDWMTERREKIQIRAYNPKRVSAQSIRLRDEHLKPLVKRLISSVVGRS